MTTLPRFLAAIAMSIAMAFVSHHAWMGQHGSNFMPGAGLDTSQVIDAQERP